MTADARRTGIGRVLLEACEAWAVARGATRVEITSSTRRTEAHAFYESRGYGRDSVRFLKRFDR